MEKTYIKEEDLVLKVSNSYDVKKFDFRKYESFVDKLCGTRDYQKEAIRNACIYLLGGRYNSLKDLANENYYQNDALREKYKSHNDFLNHLQLKDKLSCNIDLATGTGKSYVIYGIAQILLCEGKVDKVLVLAPSVTIEEGLIKKFKGLSSDRELINTLPDSSTFKNPKIIQATQTIEPGSICVENIHATYRNTKSAIYDSLLWGGHNTLVLNDESHHIFTGVNRDLKEWYKFLTNDNYGFKYVVGFTGTPYIKNSYFTDVIYRYSILQGISDKFIKKVDYVKETDKKFDSHERMQVILRNHNHARHQYHKIKPLTIFISKDIKHCERDRKNLIQFLHEQEGTSIEDLENKVLIVTSDNKHINNLEILKKVGDKNNPVEWICSVAMLTEGWDVPNVFQIVPSEERAFNSKLLISQVIGRGLRIPQEYKGEDLSVTVLNHVKFKDDINHLVDEILEKEDKIYSYPVREKKDYSFPVYNIQYDETQKEISKKVGYKAPNFKESVNLFSDSEIEDVNITYGTLGSNDEKKESVSILKQTITIDELAKEIENKLIARCIELESDGILQEEIDKLEKYDFEFIKGYIQKGLDKKGLDNQKISKANADKIKQGFGIVKRFGSKGVLYSKEPRGVMALDVYNEEVGLKRTGVSLYSIKNGKSYVFYDENSYNYSSDDDKNALHILDEESGRKYFIKIENSHLHKTPLNVTIASSKPEKEFIDLITAEKNNDIIDGFFKSKDRGFYGFEYRWTQGTRNSKISTFNPDFFIKSGNNILVIEIKGSESEKEYSRGFTQNKAKYNQAKQHFDLLNQTLEKEGINQKYYFHFCSPRDYKILMDYLRKNKIDKYTSRLEAAYEDSTLKDAHIKDLEFFDNSDIKSVFGVWWDRLEKKSQIFILTAEKNYFDNKDTKDYNFSGQELAKAFEVELKSKIFEKIRDEEKISLSIIDEEQKNTLNKLKYKTINYFNYETESLDLGTMTHLLTFNNSIIEYIKTNFDDFNFDLGRNTTNYQIVKEKNYGKINNEFWKDLPNTINFIRQEYRNVDAHGGKVFNRQELEELRNLMLFGEGILVKIAAINFDKDE